MKPMPYTQLVYTLIVVGGAIIALEANAQQADEDLAIEEIVVTGTRIVRSDFFSVSPIVTLDRSDMELSGTMHVSSLLNDLPQVDPGPQAGTANSWTGDARVNLRALGDFRTLVLLNGRRYPASSIFGSGDLNALPAGMIERVEVITGGASAVYGSDAIAGAVNFILRNDFTGIEFSSQYNVTERGDGEIYGVDLAYGTPFSDGRGHVALFGNYYKRKTVFQDARSFASSPISSNDNTGEIISDASIIVPEGAIWGQFFGLDNYAFEPSGVPRLFEDPEDRFNWTPFVALQGPMKRWSANAFGHYDLTERTRMLFELQYTHSVPEERRSDASFLELADVTIDRADFAPELKTLLASFYDPDGDGIASLPLIRRFMPERGIAVRRNERDFYRLVLGLEGDLGATWAWSADYTYNATYLDMRVSNDSSISRILQGLLVDPTTGGCLDPSDGCEPVNPFGAGNLTAAAAAFIALPDVSEDQNRNVQIANLTVRGPLTELWAGRLDGALGFEYRVDDTDREPSENLLSGDSLFNGGSGEVASSQLARVTELFAEARVPLLRDLVWVRYLGLESGIRWTDYNTLDDDVWAWKLGIEWQVTDGFRLRAMTQRAIRAPGVAESSQDSFPLGTSPFFGLNNDQCSASRDPAGSGLAALCIEQGIPADQIGIFEADFFPTVLTAASNAELDEEEANTITAGFVWQPNWLAGLFVSVDYFDIEIDNAISLVFGGDAATLCFLGRDPTAQLCNIERAPSGDIMSAKASWYNVSSVRSTGYDLVIEYNWELNSLGLFNQGASLGLSFIGNYYTEAGTQASPIAPFLDCAGKFGPLCSDFNFLGALPEFRATTRLTYRSGSFTASLRWHHIGEMTNSETEIRAINNQPAPSLAVPSVSSEDYFELTLQQQLGEHFDLSLGIFNLTDKEPPFLGSASSDANTDARTYDVMGRRYFLRFTARY
jgi:iron complex outermembrane recepter protein